MREFFRGWRRKAGCVTPLMACVFAAGCFRIQTKFDLLVVGNWVFGSATGHLAFANDTTDRNQFRIVWESWENDAKVTTTTSYSFVVALTLLSAYPVLISKPRRAKPPKSP